MANYQQFKSTMAATSRDTSHVDENGQQVEMVKSSQIVIDFDLFSEAYFKSFDPKAKKPDSVDTLCIVNDKWCLIEFKNGEFNRSEVCSKIGISVSTILCKDNIEPDNFKKNSIFILVYNKDVKIKKEESYKRFKESLYLAPSEINDSSSKDTIYALMGDMAKAPIVLFGLNTFKNVIFSNVMTMDKGIFEKYIQNEKITIPDN